MLRYNVAGMSCDHCVRAVSQAVRTIDPTASVDVDLARGEVKVESAAAPARIAEAIRAAGYEADLVQAVA